MKGDNLIWPMAKKEENMDKEQLERKGALNSLDSLLITEIQVSKGLCVSPEGQWFLSVEKDLLSKDCKEEIKPLTLEEAREWLAKNDPDCIWEEAIREVKEYCEAKKAA
jgi:hypothetical protein